MTSFASNIIISNLTARQALQKLNTAREGYKTLFVTDHAGILLGTLTDGDIRRGLINGKDIDTSVKNFLFQNFRFLKKGEYSLKEIESLKNKRIYQIPVLDETGKIERIIDLVDKKSYLPIDAIIMAGGRGERLRPLTDSVPKPLLKVGEKPIIEYNIDRLISYGINNINISIKYLGEQLITYFGSGEEKGISISYIKERQPLGTIGAVRLATTLIQDYVLVMNSDLLTNIDFEDFFKYFIENDADMAIATIPYEVNIPYAVLEVEASKVKSFKEKPTFTYYSNAGIYLLKKSKLIYIPQGEYFNATDLMECLIKENNKVVSYPILGYWLDVGKHEDFNKAQEDIKHLEL